jgi:hypothetical protein
MNERKKPRRKVGVYDRPASADRPAYIRIAVYIVAIVLAILSALYAVRAFAAEVIRPLRQDASENMAYESTLRDAAASTPGGSWVLRNCVAIGF